MSRSIDIGGRLVGDDHPVFLIAELSANHGHRRDIALKTIEAAAKAGADAIKLQTYTPDTLTLKSSSEHFVVKTKNAWAGRTLHDLYAEAMTPWEWHAELKAAAESLGLLLFSTPFDVTAVAFLERLGVPAHKVASFELTDVTLVEHVARQGKPMILSTGMASLGEIESAVATCRAVGNDQLALLRCVSAYPARPETMDLRSLETLRGFGTVLGLSDHTRDSIAAITSVALGARIIEKHFILDRAIGGPDSFFSLDPSEFRSLVDSVRSAERALGKPRFGPGEDERASVAFRRSLFVARDVQADQILTCDDVRSVRPSAGLEPRHLPAVLGRPARHALRAGEPLAWSDVGDPSTEQLELVTVTAADSASLLRWRNDPTTRAMSRNVGEVSQAEHDAWFAKRLSAADPAIFIARVEGESVGSIRLDVRGTGVAEVGITIAPEHRGRGLARRMLRALEPLARDRGFAVVVATIRPENAASVRAFKSAGYYGFAEHGPELLECERSLRG